MYNFGRRMVYASGAYSLLAFFYAYQGLINRQITGRQGVVLLSGQDAQIRGCEALVGGLLLVGLTLYLATKYWDA